MEYKTGTYKILAKKQWVCELCQKSILPKTYYFSRVKVIDETHKIYKRYHFACAKHLPNLNEYEISLFDSEINTLEILTDLKMSIYNRIISGEYETDREKMRLRALDDAIRCVKQIKGIK